ncbi:hypothetical protein ABZ820_01955 [Streptomyces diacarni]|uniref:hypothetical protein n=1 Tax=Streptomyces diacarni TaxID=2800381 RepID=UPI0033D28E26
MMLGHIRLHKLTEEHVSAWAMWSLQHGRLHGRKAGGPLSVTSVDMSLARLKEALERAKTRRMVAVNVASELHVRPKARKAERKRKEDVVPWTPGEVQVFVAAARDHEHRRFFAPLLLSLMGLRPAEVCGLR